MSSLLLPRIIRTTFTAAANDIRRFNLTCEQVYCSAGADVEFRLFDTNGSPLTEWFLLQSGQKLTVPVIDASGAIRYAYNVDVRSATVQAISFLAIIGNFEDNSLILSALSVLEVSPTGTTRTDAAAVSALNAASTLIQAGNVLDRARYVRHADASATLYIQASAGAAAVGIPLAPGDCLVLDDQSAIYARNDSGGAVNVHVSTSRTT